MSSIDDAIDAALNAELGPNWGPYEQQVKEATRAIIEAAVAAGHLIPRDRLGHDSRHIVQFTEDGWTVQHPLSERLDGTLFDCPVGFSDLREPPEFLGKFYVNADGTFDPVQEPDNE